MNYQELEIKQKIEYDFKQFQPLRKNFVHENYSKYKDWYEYDDFVQEVDMFFVVKAREYYKMGESQRTSFSMGTYYKNQYKWNFFDYIHQKEHFVPCDDKDIFNLFYGLLDIDEVDQEKNPGVIGIKIEEKEEDEFPRKRRNLKRYNEILLGAVIQYAFIMEKVSNVEKEIALLFLVDNKKQKEISELTGKSIDQVKKITQKFSKLNVNYKETIIGIPSLDKMGIPDSLSQEAWEKTIDLVDTGLTAQVEGRSEKDFKRESILPESRFYKKFYYYKRLKLRQSLLISIGENLKHFQTINEFWGEVTNFIKQPRIYQFKKIYHFIDRKGIDIITSTPNVFIKRILKRTHDYRKDCPHDNDYYVSLLKKWIKEWEDLYETEKFIKNPLDIFEEINSENFPTYNMGEDFLINLFLNTRKISQFIK